VLLTLSVGGQTGQFGRTLDVLSAECRFALLYDRFELTQLLGYRIWREDIPGNCGL